MVDLVVLHASRQVPRAMNARKLGLAGGLFNRTCKNPSGEASRDQIQHAKTHERMSAQAWRAVYRITQALRAGKARDEPLTAFDKSAND